jgi:hypothetical protein
MNFVIFPLFIHISEARNSYLYRQLPQLIGSSVYLLFQKLSHLPTLAVVLSFQSNAKIVLRCPSLSEDPY